MRDRNWRGGKDYQCLYGMVNLRTFHLLSNQCNCIPHTTSAHQHTSQTYQAAVCLVASRQVPLPEQDGPCPQPGKPCYDRSAGGGSALPSGFRCGWWAMWATKPAPLPPPPPVRIARSQAPGRPVCLGRMYYQENAESTLQRHSSDAHRS